MLGFGVEEGLGLQNDLSVVGAFTSLNRLDVFAVHRVATISDHVAPVRRTGEIE